MDRRNFMKMLAVLGAGSTLPLWNGNSFAAPITSLPIPSVITPDSSGNIKLALQTGASNWAGKPAVTWGINGPLLGPALRLNSGQQVNVEVTNNLPEDSTLHWHGLEVPGTSDGGPQAVIAKGSTWKTEFKVQQPAATCWFHPHTHGRTGYQVAMGLGGLILIEDDESKKFKLPSNWGEDDIPVILQDKMLNNQGQIDYSLDLLTAAVGWFGNTMLTNGVTYPKHSVVSTSGWIRLRFLNACNARSLVLATSDKRPMYVIASDCGFLPEPVKVHELPIYTGERFEVLIEVSNNKPFDIVTLPVTQTGMGLSPFDTKLPVLYLDCKSGKKVSKLPEQLVPLPALPALNNIPIRKFSLNMDSAPHQIGIEELEKRYGSRAVGGSHMGGGMHRGGMRHGGKETKSSWSAEELLSINGINGQPFKMDSPAFNVKAGTYERWVISSMHMMLHPFHVHGARFRILSEHRREPALHRRGWKDIVVTEHSSSEILVRFEHTAPKERAYMAHCHLLEHEDTGMMLSFTVSR